MESGHRFDAQTLHSFIQAVFRQMGSEEQEAKLVADHLIAANLAGHDSHGIGMIPSYVRSWSQGHLQINHHAKTVKESGAAVTLDGDRAFGQVAAHEAMALGIEKAHQHGIAAVALHNSHHIGRIGYWA
ncbi:TPA: malate/lactate/ureidoglycolate dehydrogenase, partial [Escherichia coli]|nr:malate/lactate/ureidoglycolate dehydrogenase [Escherichia coli]